MRALLAVVVVSTGCFATQRPVVPQATVASATVPTAHARVGCIAST